MHSPASDQPVVPRTGLAAWIWGFLVLAVIAATIPQFLWHVEFFKITVFHTDRRYTAADVAELERTPYRFLILPSAANLAELEQAATAVRTIRLLHGDAHFRVYEVQ